MAAFPPAAESSPFTQAVVQSMRKLYPETLADKSFDNTGLLLEAPCQPQQQSVRKSNSVLLTIDLTRAVADEAIEGNYQVVVAYHPIIFRGLKSLTLGDSQQASLLRLAAHGISVYSPHTAVDIVPGGMADWLCDIVTGKVDGPSPEVHTGQKQDDIAQAVIAPTATSKAPSAATPAAPAPGAVPTAQRQESTPTSTLTSVGPLNTSQPQSAARPQTLQRTYSKPTYIQPSTTPVFHPDTIPHTRSVITPSPPSDIQAANTLNTDTDTTTNNSSNLPSAPSSQKPPKYTPTNTGHGRLITFTHPQPLPLLVSRIATALNHPKAITIAIPQSSTIESLSVRTVGVCPGSGGSVFRGVRGKAPDLLFTGEMSHHEALAVVEQGGVVIALGHSNSERGYLSGVMRGLVEEEVGRVWGRRGSKKGKEFEGQEEEKDKEGEDNDGVSVVVSERDRDPFGIVVLEEG